MKTRSFSRLIRVVCPVLLLFQAANAQQQSTEAGFHYRANKTVYLLKENKEAVFTDLAMKRTGFVGVTQSNRFHKFSTANIPKQTMEQKLFSLWAIAASIDGTKIKEKEEYYKKKAMAAPNFEAIWLIREDLIPNPFDTKPNENSIEAEPTEKAQSYLQLRTGLRVCGRGEVQEADNDVTYKTYIYYLTLPLYLLYNHRSDNGSDKFFAGLGPYYGYGLFGKFVDEINGETTKENIKFGEDESGLRHGDFGLGFVAGYVFNRVMFQLSYDLGLSNITFDKDTKASNRAFGLSIWYVLHN